MKQVAVQGSGYRGETGPLFLIDYVPQDRVLLSGVPLATKASRIGQSEVRTGNPRVLVAGRFPVAGEGSEIDGPVVKGTVNQDTSDRALMSDF